MQNDATKISVPFVLVSLTGNLRIAKKKTLDFSHAELFPRAHQSTTKLFVFKFKHSILKNDEGRLLMT